MHNIKTLKLSELIKSELYKVIKLGKIFSRELDIDSIFIFGVIISPDSSLAKCYITSLDKKDLDKSVYILNSISNKIRHELAQNLNLRKTPKITFYPDYAAPKSMEYQDKYGF